MNAPESRPGDGAALPEDFDAGLYLRLNQDVAAAVAAGAIASAAEHFLAYGAKEGRRYRATLDEPPPRGAVVLALERVASAPGQANPRPPAPMAHALEALRVAPGGGVYVAGWIDDAGDPLIEILVQGDDWSLAMAGGAVARVRRRDVEPAADTSAPHAFGFWAFADLGRAPPRPRRCRVRLRTAGGVAITLDVACRGIGDEEVRDLVLAGLADSDWFAPARIGAVAALAGGIGAQIVTHNRRLVAGLVASPYVERFGPRSGRPAASLVVCLYGRPDYLALQSALFAGGSGFADCEVIYVCNSPELAERLQRDARIAALVHGARLTLVLLAGNAGFAAANNAAARFAESDRIIACNPDVFPLQPDWARRHADILATRPAAQTALFGAPLFYDTGALMHAGMYFEIDAGLIPAPGGVAAQDIIRVQHYGKGAPPDSAALLRPRPVPAVTGAFISCRRDWFERLDGFSEDYVFGHFEDADLCLRSLGLGVAPWLHDVRMYHLEGQGAARAAAQQGAMFVNQWLFGHRWAATLRDGLLGPQPSHKLLREPPPPRRGRARP